jgi:hypothetical protein
MTWDIQADPDPFLTASFSITNNTNATQTYTTTIFLPIAPALSAPTLIGGSAQVGISTDDNGGTVSSVGGDTIYTALIDGVPVAGLFGPGYSFTRPAFTTDQSGVSEFGTPIPSMPGPAANASIAIRFTFDLTPGDSASMTGLFVVVPEPGTVALIVPVLAGMGLWRRRRPV